jgi:hypothetical protein
MWIKNNLSGFVFFINIVYIRYMKDLDFITNYIETTLNNNFKDNRFMNLKIDNTTKNQNENSIHFEFNNEKYIISCSRQNTTRDSGVN